MNYYIFAAGVAELVDALGLGPSGATLESSSLSARTTIIIFFHKFMFYFLHNFIPSSILWQAGPLTIRYYGLVLLLAMIAAILLSIKIASWYQIQKEKIIDLAIYLIIGGLIGARIYEIFLEFSYYQNNPLAIFKVWQGGLAIHGGIIGGFIALYLFSHDNKISLLKLSALVVPGLALGQAIGRWGNWFNQELFGLPSALPWSIPISPVNRPSNYLNFNFFHPTFLYESLACLVLAALLFYFAWRWRKNEKNQKFIVIIYLSSYAFIRFMLEFIKIDETPVWLGLRWPQIASLLMIIPVFILLIKNYQLAKK